MFNADTKEPQMSAAEALTIQAAEHAAMIKAVREEYGVRGINEMQRLMRRTNTSHAEDAISAEARQRILRNRWAAVTSKAA